MARNASEMGIVGKIFVSLLFGGLFIGGGILFFYFMLSSGMDELDARNWEATPCNLLESEITKGDQAYEFNVRYAYTYNGQSHTSSIVSIGYDGDDDYGDAQRLAHSNPVEGESTCYVNPDNPAEAVLRQDFPWTLLALPFPLLFIGAGCAVVYALWFKSNTPRAEADDSISEKANEEDTLGARLAGAGFFSIFLLAGLGFLIPFFLLPGLRILGSGSWQETPGRVVESEVWTNHDSDGDTYSVNVLYEYKVEGRVYRSNQYGFFGGSSSGYSGKEAIVKAHPPGHETICWVNPDDPYDAVLSRGASRELAFGLIPIIFVLIGGGGVYFSLFGNSKKSAALSDKGVPVNTDDTVMSPIARDETYGQVELKPESSRIGGCIGIGIFALFWNGIVSVFVVSAFSEGGGIGIFMGLFMIPFVLIGLAAFFGGIYTFLGLFNPTPKLVLGTGHLPLGESTWLKYSLEGKVASVKRLRILLEAREEVRYVRGTDTVTETSDFHRDVILDTNNPVQMSAGEVEMLIPFETMHSFESDNNKIIWSVRIHGDIPYWPDLDETFDFTVLPLSPGEGT